MMRRRLLAITAALGVAGASLVMAPAAQAIVAPNPTATVTTGIAFGSPTQVVLDWTEDSTDDTATVTVAPSGGTGCSGVFTTDDSCTITGLTAGTSYTFTVRVFEGSDDTTATVAATPATVPDKPTIVATTAGNGSAWIDWTAPATGGSAITGYTATATATGQTTRTCTPTPATGTDCILTSLANGTTYSVQVTATNAMGTSLPSTAVPVLPSATSGLPSTPTAVSATTTSATAAEVSFTPAAAVTGFPDIDYSATCTSTNGGTQSTGTATTSPITVGSLTTDRTYTCTVKARNANGDSVASSASNGFTPNSAGVLGAPTIGTATGGSLQATVSWTAPSPATGLTGYQVSYLLNGVWSSPINTGSTSTSFTVTSLAAGSYNFRVRALTVGGAGAWSNQSSPAVTVTSGTLNAPTGVSGTPGAAQVSLTWTAPSGGTLSPTSYQVRYSANSGSTWTELAATGTTTTSATISGLTNGTAYVFAVRAINGAVTSDWSATSTAVTPGAPGVPTNVTGTAGDARVNLTWTAPTGTPAATGYQVQYSSNNGTTWLPATPLAATTTSLAVTGLTNGTAYVFQVRAVNGTVTGNYSARSAAVTPVAAVTKSIVIEGTRGTGKNLIRVYIDGIATGFAAGTKLVPQFRFPGQRGFTNGTARPTVDEDAFFTWSRKAGKQIVIRFATESGDVTSNPVKIPARR